MSRSARLRLAVALVATCAGLALAEVVARRAYGEGFASLVDPYEFHAYRPFTRYELRSAGRSVRIQTNSLGWKDAAPRQVAYDPRPRRRLVFLGDSFTEGLGLPQEETLSRYAEQRLNGQGEPYEVLNGGRLSHSPLLEYQRLKRFVGRGYRADVVVVLPDVSDPQDELYYASRFSWSPSGEPVQIDGALYRPPLRPLFNRSALVRWGYRWFERWFPGPPEEQHPARLPAPRPGSGLLLPDAPVLSLDAYDRLPAEAKTVLRANWPGHPPSVRGWAADGVRLLETDLLRIRDLAERQGMRLLVAIYPWPQMLYTEPDPALYRLLVSRFGPWYRQREYVYGRRPAAVPSPWEEALQGFCDLHGIELVNLFPAFREAGDWPRLYLPGDVHFSAAGHRLAGEAIADAILAGRDRGTTGPGLPSTAAEPPPLR